MLEMIPRASQIIMSPGFICYSNQELHLQYVSRAEPQRHRGRRNLKPTIQIGTICCWGQGLDQYQSRLDLAVLCASASLRENVFQFLLMNPPAIKLGDLGRISTFDLRASSRREVPGSAAAFVRSLYPTPLLIARTIEPNSRIAVPTVTSHSGRLMRNIGSPIRRIAPKNNTRYGTRMS